MENKQMQKENEKNNWKKVVLMHSCQSKKRVRWNLPMPPMSEQNSKIIPKKLWLIIVSRTFVIYSSYIRFWKWISQNLSSSRDLLLDFIVNTVIYVHMISHVKWRKISVNTMRKNRAFGCANLQDIKYFIVCLTLDHFLEQSFTHSAIAATSLSLLKPFMLHACVLCHFHFHFFAMPWLDFRWRWSPPPPPSFISLSELWYMPARKYSVVSFCTRCCFRCWFTTISSISAINYRWFIYLTFKRRRSLKILISCKYWCKAQNIQISSDRNRLSLSLPPFFIEGGFMENMCKMKETDKKSV